MFPRVLEKFLDGILSGELLRNLDVKVDKSMEKSKDDNWQERAFQRASAEPLEFSPDEQLSMNLDFTPSQDSQPEGKVERFGRTG